MNATDLLPHLLACAACPDRPETLALAGTMARAQERRGPWRAPVAGLAMAELESLLCIRFPNAADLHALLLGWQAAAPAVTADGEFGDLVALLLAHRSDATGQVAEAVWLAHAVATASMADNHLWQDLGLPSRVELNELMANSFGPLKAKNVGDMKWKKFFYRQLCEAADVLICKSPSCRECTDFATCFGPED